MTGKTQKKQNKKPQMPEHPIVQKLRTLIETEAPDNKLLYYNRIPQTIYWYWHLSLEKYQDSHEKIEKRIKSREAKDDLLKKAIELVRTEFKSNFGNARFAVLPLYKDYRKLLENTESRKLQEAATKVEEAPEQT